MKVRLSTNMESRFLQLLYNTCSCFGFTRIFSAVDSNTVLNVTVHFLSAVREDFVRLRCCCVVARVVGEVVVGVAVVAVIVAAEIYTVVS